MLKFFSKEQLKKIKIVGAIGVGAIITIIVIVAIIVQSNNQKKAETIKQQGLAKIQLYNAESTKKNKEAKNFERLLRLVATGTYDSYCNYLSAVNHIEYDNKDQLHTYLAKNGNVYVFSQMFSATAQNKDMGKIKVYLDASKVNSLTDEGFEDFYYDLLFMAKCVVIDSGNGQGKLGKYKLTEADLDGLIMKSINDTNIEVEYLIPILNDIDTKIVK